MGNCTRADFVEDDTNYRNDKLLADLEKLKMKYRVKDPVVEMLEQLVPAGYLKDIRHFRDVYRIKKNLKCQKDVFYRIKVLENTRSGRLFNVKIIKKSDIMKIGMDNYKTIFYSEMKIMDTFKHPNVESLIDVYYDIIKEDVKIYIVTNYTSKNSLLDVINNHIQEKSRFEDKEISIIMKLLIETVYKFKSHNIMHRNLSPENIFFLKDGVYYTICVRNFYFSTCEKNSKSQRGMTGGLWYMAPEMIKDMAYDYQSEVWSLGVIFYMLTTLENPFRTLTTREALLDASKNFRCFRSIKELKRLGLNPDALDLIYRMLVEDPNQRIAIEMMLEDPFFKLNEKFYFPRSTFTSYIDYKLKDLLTLIYKIRNLESLHDIIFFLIYNLKDYFIDVEEIIFINEFYKYFDKNNDGQVSIVEMQDTLLNDGYDKEMVQNYLKIIETVVKNDYRRSVITEFLIDSISYDFFVASNVLLKMFRDRNNNQTQKKVEILFNEMDLDKNHYISIDEIQSFFKNRYPKKISNIMKGIYNDPLFDKNVVKTVDEFSIDDIKSLLFYECVKLTTEQEEELAYLENKGEEFNLAKEEKMKRNTMKVAKHKTPK
jgi:serine/threonine protein kinase